MSARRTTSSFYLYTSGTTGLPKGVMLTNEGMSYTRRLAHGILADGAGQRQSRRDADVPHRRLRLRLEHDVGRRPHRADARSRSRFGCRISSRIHRVTHVFFVPTVVQVAAAGSRDRDRGSLKSGAPDVRRVADRRRAAEAGAGPPPVQFHAGLWHDRVVGHRGRVGSRRPRSRWAPRGPAARMRSRTALGRATGRRSATLDDAATGASR